MKLKNKKTQVYLMIILIVAILIGIGYAILTSNLNILGNTTINKNTWDIHLENLSVTEGSITATTPAAIDSNNTTVNFTVKLATPGDFYEFTVDEVNDGTIDGMISSIVKTGLTEAQAKYLDYTVSYSDGTVVSEKQLLASNQTETIKVRVEFKKDLTASDLPTTDTTLDLSFSINYIQADSSAVAIRQKPVCKRAMALHTSLCSTTNSTRDGKCAGQYSIGDTITYGNLGTEGTLTSGDAFDCDVNGDGVYDSETERFYYVSNYYDTVNSTFNDDYATLIYYSNVSGGVVDNTKSYAYGLTYDGNLDRETAILQLPTILQWNNVNLLTTTRNITDHTGTIIIEGFSYEGYAARLLTVEEIKDSCNLSFGQYDSSTNVSGCSYIEENLGGDQRGWWLENIKSNNSNAYNYDYYNNCFMADDSISSSAKSGMRPAIEVLKSRISY